MTREEVLAELETLGSERMREHNAKYGAGSNQFGVKMGDIRNIAKKIKKDHALALELWKTGNVEARFVATLILTPKALSKEQLEDMVKSEKFTHLADWLYNYVIKEYPDTEPLRQKWMQSKDPMCGRAGWSLTSGAVSRRPEILNIPALLDRIESDMPTAAPEVQWTMNNTLANIGIRMPEHRKRALAIGEKLGIYRDYPVSKGCTSPFAPIWINEMVKRQEKSD